MSSFRGTLLDPDRTTSSQSPTRPQQPAADGGQHRQQSGRFLGSSLCFHSSRTSSLLPLSCTCYTPLPPPRHDPGAVSSLRTFLFPLLGIAPLHGQHAPTLLLLHTNMHTMTLNQLSPQPRQSLLLGLPGRRRPLPGRPSTHLAGALRAAARQLHAHTQTQTQVRQLKLILM